MSGVQARAYKAEELFLLALDNVGDDGMAVVRFEGVDLNIPGDIRFGSTEALERYSRHVLSRVDVRSRYVNAASPVSWRFDRRYHNPLYRSGSIAMPPFPHRKYREAVVLHELAHHLVDDMGPTGHGHMWQEAFAFLVEEVMSPEAALYLRYLMVSVTA